jgi:hypothetical protein
MEYASSAETLAQRIRALIPANPKILAMTSAWKLTEIEEFKYDDLQPSTFQAQWALKRAQELYADEAR